MRKVNWILIFSILGGIIVIFSAIAQHLKEQKDKKELAAKDAEIKKLLSENYDSVKAVNTQILKVNDLQQKLNTVQAELIESSKKNIELNEEINKNITGGDSHPVLSMWFGLYKTENGFDQKFSSIGFQITNKGKYPLRSIRFIIYDNLKNIEKVISKDENVIRTEMNPNVNTWTEEWAKSIEVETLPNTLGYKDLYQTRFLKEMGKFQYFIEILWMGGAMTYSIKGNYDNKNDNMVVTNIQINPLKDGINPLEYVEIHPKNVAGELSHYTNPLTGLIKE